ncbi:exosome-associated factor Rrp47/DNA strand repair C1D [Suhomyces tanzawaensis NRRL Y-17324]|uniref:Exosome complex protein n=1 Tax=Suhomyces tanzawaensis NRRL Y-17324 TaxID=984487 RepID=A0A1E4SDI6_9ASCO|nr:exosome-associated factor Rrp47/DNA strand repair C1D [Suhomyces tanzawaensis NRRL Y-17324]ODV77526.1 exosome-associated factor Rrp47/DNA strand repair C1D [Suhomyces tanzawaensis NRRL Y-17324]
MENLDNVRLYIKSLDNTVDLLQESLEPILKKSLDELIAGVPSDNHIDKIKIYNNYAYTLISLMFSYLKSVGVNTEGHPIMDELTRIKTYMKRLKDLETGAKGQEDKDKQDAEKAKEFLQNALGTRANGGGAAASDGMKGPAISSVNFKGTHTRFELEANEQKGKPGKVTKPKKKKKSKD